jgi:hypothetical protein
VFTGDYDDKGVPADAARLAEGHLEMIGIAQHEPFSDFGLAVSHDQATGMPLSCSRAADLLENEQNGGYGEDLNNLLAFNGYLSMALRLCDTT